MLTSSGVLSSLEFFWTQTAELTQPDVLKASRFPSLFSAITRIIDVILMDIRKRIPNLVNSRWLWKISRGIWGNQYQQPFLEYAGDWDAEESI